MLRSSPVVTRKCGASELTTRAPAGTHKPLLCSAGSLGVIFANTFRWMPGNGTVLCGRPFPSWRPGEDRCPPNTKSLKWTLGLKIPFVYFKKWPVFQVVMSPPVVHEPSSFPTSSPWAGSIFNFRHSDRCRVMSHQSFICISLMTNAVEHFFVHLFALQILLGWMDCLNALSIFHWVIFLLSFESSLWILGPSP